MPQAPNDYMRFSETLIPVFKTDKIDIVHYASALLRVSGPEDEGWDTLEESRQILEDLIRINQLELPRNHFENVDKTHWRLHLLSYVHLIEMNAPYHVLANLLRVRAGMPYNTRPFREMEDFQALRPAKGKTRGQVKKIPITKPTTKIGEIKMLTVKAGAPEIGRIFDEFYFYPLRNAIAHSNYVLHQDEMRMLINRIPDEKKPEKLVSIIPFLRLESIISLAYDFYTAFFTMENLARSELLRLKGVPIPYDDHLKGIAEFLFDDKDLLCGIKLHWPNGQESVYLRNEEGCESKNIFLEPDGRINFHPGKKFGNVNSFSPLLAAGKKPQYTPLQGSDVPLEWTKK